jgi:hypothetical protein
VANATDVIYNVSEADATDEVRVTSHRKEIITRMTVWLLFGVIFGLFPLIASGIVNAILDHGFSVTEVLSKGELFIVSAVTAAGAMGELFAGAFENSTRLLIILAGFTTLMTFAGNTVAYVAISISSHLTHSTVMHWSLAFYLVTLLASGFSIGMAVGR